jgi:hypothetical protein
MGIKRPSANAFQNAKSPITYLLFNYITPLVAFGRANQLELEDCPALRPQDTAEAVADRLQNAWERNLDRKHGIWRALVSNRSLKQERDKSRKPGTHKTLPTRATNRTEDIKKWSTSCQAY